MPATVGIDLGTTNSLIAVMQADGPKLIPNALGEFLTPSIVGVDQSNEILVGAAAKEYQVMHPVRCASVFKRHMGSDWTVTLAKQKFTAIDLSSFVLRSLKADAESFLGEPVQSAVITVPAYFNEEQRRATIAAGRMAGLQVDRILNEPTAAAIAYGMHSDDEKLAVVLDLGGGTFDVSVLEMFEGTLEIRSSAGEIFLGGEDITNTLASQVLSRNSLTYEWIEMREPLRLSRLRRECEMAKRKLTREDSAEIRLPDAKGGLSESCPRLVVTREDLRVWSDPILERIVMPIRRALGDANVKREQIDEIILVGGATRMPALVDRVKELFCQEPRCSLNPDEVVALGAAVHGGIIDRHETLNEMVVTDVCPFTLGVEISKEIGGDNQGGFYLPIINRSSTIPISRVSVVNTVHPNQTQMKISVYQGESRLVKDNLLLGEFTVTGIPRGPAGQGVALRFTYDLNGILEVEATISETKKKVSHVFTRHAKGLKPDQIKLAVEKMAALKMSPRDDAANSLILKRAERLYAELPLRERGILDAMISGFEEVLELRDQQAIVAFRERLTEFLSMYDSSNEDDYQSEW
ncbi:Hsp70 family protein [Planctomicrobium sp. SH668]|uniref:Hsp70 family protein n=1 Tax=Planctomicrobium sp. SH668 TaxID=3448126 RepID=UPI003F5BD902